MEKTVRVTQEIVVEIDESKFTEDFLNEFSCYMFDADIEEHIKYLAGLYACEIIDEDSFIEGYGPAKDFGIKFKRLWLDEEFA